MSIERHRSQLLILEQELKARVGVEVAHALDTDVTQAESGDLSVADDLKDDAFALADSDRSVLTEVQAALQRIGEGGFGHCAVDGEPIEEKRLDAVPWTRYCLKHQTELEEKAALKTPTS